MEKLKLVIFDMDGVLVDSEPAITTAAMESLRERGIEAEYEDFKEYTGMGDDKFIGGVAEKYGIKYEKGMKRRAYEIYILTAPRRVKVYEWTRGLIEGLMESGIKVSIASASDSIKVRCNIKCIGINESRYGSVVTGSEVEKKKPEPDIFIKAAMKAKISPDNALVIEDSLSGVKAAKAAGMSCIGVTTSFTYEQIKESGADYIFEDLNKTLEFLRSM